MGLEAAAMAVTTAATVYGGVQQNKAGKAAAKAADNESKRAAEQEGANIREEAIERRERLIRALSSQTASVGASGARLGGSALNLMEEDQRQFESEDFRARLSGSSKIAGIREGGRNRSRAHRMGAKLSLVDTVASVGNIGMQAYSPPKTAIT